VTLKGETDVVGQTTIEGFNTVAPSTITEIKDTTGYVTVGDQIWTPFSDYTKKNKVEYVSRREIQDLYNGGVEISWKLGDATKIHIYLVRDDKVGDLIGPSDFDWTKAADRESDTFCRGFGDFPECPWGRGHEQRPENPWENHHKGGDDDFGIDNNNPDDFFGPPSDDN
jgi:hypothetical protein